MKYMYTILACFILFTVQSNAQPGEGFKNREEIRKKKYAFIMKELQLTEKEKSEFIPLYKEYDGKREYLHEKRRKMMEDFKRNNLNMSNEDINRFIDSFIETDIKLAELNKTYTAKFKTVIPPMKIILLHQAENEFKKNLLKHIHRNRQGPKH